MVTQVVGKGAGTTVVLPLPRTKLEYRGSTERFVHPSSALSNQHVIPNIVVKTTVQDKIKGSDPVLDATLEMIRSGD